jgi:hypothetical protein
MRKQKVLPREFDFYFADLDNMVLVQSKEDGSVTIRTTRDNFSDERKVFFLRQLAAEGFIPDHYQWLSDSTKGSFEIKWVKDRSWVKVHATVTRRTNRIMRALLVGSCILWVAIMRVIFVSNPPQPVMQVQNALVSPRIAGALPANSTDPSSLVP